MTSISTGNVSDMYGIGSASFVSRLLGQNKKAEADTVASTTFATSLATAVLVMIVLTLFLKPVLSTFGATPDIIDLSVSYGRILVFGAIFIITNMTLNNILRAEGSANFSMMALLTGAIDIHI
jgi:Na+-driven multidrug efflux pump